MTQDRAVQEPELTETGRCCALLEAVLRGLGSSNCWAVDDRPDWETGMARPSGEERRFAVLLEKVEGEFRVVAEGLADLSRRLDRLQDELYQQVQRLDLKIERVAHELSERMDAGFAAVMKELRNHHHS